MSDRPAIVVAPGFMGDPNAWCFWDEEFPDDATYGPYASWKETMVAVMMFCSWEEETIPVRLDETMTDPRLMRGHK